MRRATTPVLAHGHDVESQYPISKNPPGGIFFPLAKALCLACGSDPEKGTAKKMGAYVMKTCFQVGSGEGEGDHRTSNAMGRRRGGITGQGHGRLCQCRTGQGKKGCTGNKLGMHKR